MSYKSINVRKRTLCGGNALVEIVFTLLPTFALIFGFVDFGLLIFRWSTLQNAVREGCRYAITFQTMPGKGQDASIKTVVEQFSLGIVKLTDSPSKMVVNYYATSNMNTPINPGGNQPGNIVEVSVQGISWAQLAPISGAFSAGVPMLRSTAPISLNIYASDILGGYPVGVNSVAR